MKRIEVPDEIIKEAQPIDDSVQKMAQKLKLHRTQVKGILKALYEVPELLNTAMQQAGEAAASEDDKETTTPEIRHTRNAAKKVVEEGGKVNWILEKINESDKTPEKKRGRKRKNPEVLFNAAEFPDEDDEEYDPAKDIADISDEDGASDTTGTPMSSSMISPPFLDRSIQTPKSSNSNLDSNDFKKPQEVSTVVRALNFEAEPRTLRSKNDLKEVTIEELEMLYNPPDITDDLYDDNLEHDDYAKFLAETYYQPITPKAADASADATADDHEDPDFEYHEQDEDALYANSDELKFNRSTKISQKEADELLSELFEDYDIDVKNRKKDANKDDKNEGVDGNGDKQGCDYNNQYNNYYHHFNYACQLSHEQRSIISQQMRQHIQLLTQMSLLSSKDLQWEVLNKDCKHMLHELYDRSYNNSYSVYHQDNLCPSLNLLDQWENNQRSAVPTVSKEKSGKTKYELSPELLRFIGDHPSLAFPYPQMLPCSALKPTTQKMLETDKPYFAKAEDNLIVLGLETYFGGTDKWKKEGYAKAATFVSKTLMRSKTAKHIRVRIKNRKDKCRVQTENAITYYHQHNAAPRIAAEDLQPYQPNYNLVKNGPNLPDFYGDFFKTEKGDGGSPVASQSSLSKVYPTIAPTTVRLPEVQFTITPQFDLVMLPNEEAKMSNDPSQSSKNKKGSSKKNSHPVQTLPKATKPILPKQIVIPPIQSEQAFDEDPLGVEDEENSQETPTTATVPEPDMPSFTSPQKSLAEENVPPPSEFSKVAEPPTSSIASSPPTSKPVSSSSKSKSSKQLREAELTLQLLESERPDEESFRKQHEALEISMNAQEQLSSDKFQEFCRIVVNDNISNKQKFMELHTICAGKMELQDMLLDLLTDAGEAHEISNDIYAQYCLRDAVKTFFRKVKISFQVSNPLVYSKILKDFQHILGQTNVQTEDIVNLGHKYFKNSPQLLDEFMTFAEEVPYPKGLLPDPEVIDLSDEEDEDKATFEEKINLLDDEDDLGGPICPCSCHPALTGSNHCTHCSLKFINGKVYCRDGKMLKPVKVQYAKAGKSISKKKQRKRK